MKLFRNQQGKWVFLIRPCFERFVPRCIPTDVARIGTDTNWVRVL